MGSSKDEAMATALEMVKAWLLSRRWGSLAALPSGYLLHGRTHRLANLAPIWKPGVLAR
jgi:hypothetical protein